LTRRLATTETSAVTLHRFTRRWALRLDNNISESCSGIVTRPAQLAMVRQRDRAPAGTRRSAPSIASTPAFTNERARGGCWVPRATLACPRAIELAPKYWAKTVAGLDARSGDPLSSLGARGHPDRRKRQPSLRRRLRPHRPRYSSLTTLRS
jgi:hypothetical protein